VPDVSGEETAGQGGRDIVVAEVPARELLAAKEHMDDLLRELQLVLLDTPDHDQDPTTDQDQDPGQALAQVRGQVRGPVSSPQRTVEVVALARRLDASARPFEGVRRQVREQVARAVVAGQHRVTLRLDVSPGGGAAAAAYRSAVEAAEVLALDGGLLTMTDHLGRHGEVRRAYLDEVIAQASHR